MIDLYFNHMALLLQLMWQEVKVQKQKVTVQFVTFNNPPCPISISLKIVGSISHKNQLFLITNGLIPFPIDHLPRIVPRLLNYIL